MSDSDGKELWQWRDLCLACGLTPADGPSITGISIDSRSISNGELFIALSGDPGPRFHSSGSRGLDGHDFVESARANSAAGLMVSAQVDSILPQLHVNDTLDGLWYLGTYARQAMTGKVIAITGSSGKTTVRQWLEQVLEKRHRTHASLGSLNNHWGVPLSLARMPVDSEYGVIEIGTNNPGEIAPLSRLAAPDVALVLNVLPAHLGRFDSIDALATEKLSIAEGLKDNGIVVLPDYLASKYKISGEHLTFGTGSDADVWYSATLNSDHTNVEIAVDDCTYSYQLPETGAHRIESSVAVVAMLVALDVSPEFYLSSFSKLTTPKGRGNTIDVAGIKVIDDSYNANPVSVKHALDALSAHSGYRVALLGEMLELGEASREMHRSLAEVCKGLDGVITVGEGFADWDHSLGDEYWGHYESATAIDLEQLANRLPEGSRLLIKGANKVFWVNQFVDRLVEVISQK